MSVTAEFIHRYIDLAQPRLGAEVIEATDDFFAPKERLIKAEAPIFIPDKYDEHGKWMDGWESRRKRGEGHDFCVIRLCPGTIHGLDIDTSFFTGNYPPAASLEACHSGTTPDEGSDWITLIPSTSLKGNSHHYFTIDNNACFTHVRLNIYPDGGVARLRVHGRVVSDVSALDKAAVHDLAAVELGARAIAWNDAHFGAVANLLNPGRGVNMGDGWETRRRREPGNDWCIIELGHPGKVEQVILDTAFFKGNYPDRCSLQAALVGAGTADSIVTQSQFWQELLPPQKMAMDKVHEFSEAVQDLGPVSHVRINVFPDGGLSRVRLLGKIDD